MKQALGLLAIFPIFCITGTFAGAVLYILYIQCVSYTAGLPMETVSFAMCVAGVIKTVPSVLLFSPLFLALNLIRHPKRFLAVITFYLIEAIALFFLFPLSLRMPSYFKTSTAVADHDAASERDAGAGCGTGAEHDIGAKRTVTSGFFRKNGQYLYYYSAVRSDGSASGVKFKLEDVSASESRNPKLIDGALSISAAAPETASAAGIRPSAFEFSDVLAEEILKPPFTVKTITCLFFLPALITSNSGAEIDVIIMFSMCFALIAVCAVKHMSQWRLINVFFVIALTMAVLFANTGYYCKNEIFMSLSKKAEELLPLSDIPFIAVLNTAVGFLSFVFSLLFMIVRKRRLK
ncbi:hypothetical protein [Treponema parvum]|uniref:hypothetical protein n=1 Tax=Treponema parvum TaxID=138851 RepID=UPI001AEBE11E|nr:hypothetical protein [Treponema parvum]QTQ15523.1 hypothetical protein HXT04_01705 [Treponema parvum]